MKNESITKTFAVATALCVVCAIIVSLSDVMLKETQLRNKALDKQVNILSAAGLVEPGAKVSAEEAASLFANAETVVLKLAGIDMSGPEPIRKALEVFRETVKKMHEATGK